ncbi:glycosyltransferase family 2 protein [Spirochaeta thermophila]|uniref:Putative glycosyltransferase n=1 Tax=Winmispira thermophila (strain ATCC 49972 / DSM 6192 / RI 19.B1) TaxID=665571 RepID=E0RP39_WINT6|nr:glycosyltransferase family 2 protein [Spirochaeta thermophila]ADN02701.1 putative glycosyltransferase [Spirochaeta thermophila DSM 6192]
MISIIIPVYNEEEVLPALYERLTRVMEGTGEAYELVFVDDGSTDRTYQLLKDLHRRDPRCKVIHFSRNFGHQIAITAGMDHARGDAVIIIDADLQDPPELIPRMLEKWRAGAQIVHARRVKRKGEGLFKRATAALFYRILKALTDVEIPVDVGDFRLMDRKVVDSLKGMRERNRFVRGLVSWTGFRQDEVTYVRDPRYAGTTKYPLGKMIRFALNGITSFSDKPLKVASLLGSLLSLAGFLYLLYVLYLRLFTDRVVQGWASIVVLILVFNGFTLLSLGILGEYVGRIYDEVKQRPLYIVEEALGVEEKEMRHG